MPPLIVEHLRPSDAPPVASICILGGTNIGSAFLQSPVLQQAFTIETPFGRSPTYYYGSAEGVPFYHVLFHGASGLNGAVAENESLLRTWSSLHQLQVSDVFGGATAGGIRSDLGLGHWVVADDFIDFNVDRKRSVVGDILAEAGARVLPRCTPADDPLLRELLIAATTQVAGQERVHPGGVIVQAAGGRFETAAEIRMFRQLGADLVTMNVPTEMVYARQLNINYSSIIAISNPAEGLGAWAWQTLQDLYPQLHQESVAIYLRAVRLLDQSPDRRRIGDTLRIHPEFD